MPGPRSHSQEPAEVLLQPGPGSASPVPALGRARDPRGTGCFMETLCAWALPVGPMVGDPEVCGSSVLPGEPLPISPACAVRLVGDPCFPTPPHLALVRGDAPPLWSPEPRGGAGLSPDELAKGHQLGSEEGQEFKSNPHLLTAVTSGQASAPVSRSLKREFNELEHPQTPRSASCR